MADSGVSTSADSDYVCMHLRRIGRRLNRPGNSNLIWYVVSFFVRIFLWEFL